MTKICTLAAFLIVSFVPAALAQAPAPDKAALRAKKDACQAEAKAKNIADKVQHKSFIESCMKK